MENFTATQVSTELGENGLSDDLLNNTEVRYKLKKFFYISYACSIVLFVFLTIYGSKMSIFFINNFMDLIMFVLIITGIIYLPLPMSYFGLKLENVKNDLIKALPITLIWFVLAATLRVILYYNVTTTFAFHFPLTLKDSTYPIGALTQETATRGFFQGYLYIVFAKNKNCTLLSILIPTIAFSLFHLFSGLAIVFGAFAFSIVMGIIYHKTRSVFGIALIHMVASAALFCSSGF